MDNNNFEERIEEIEEEVKQELDEVQEEVNEAPEEAKTEIAKVVDQVLGALKGFKEAVVNFDINGDGVTLGNHLETLSETVNKAVSDAGDKLNALTADEKTSETLEKAKAGLDKVSASVGAKVKEVYENLKADAIAQGRIDASVFQRGAITF